MNSSTELSGNELSAEKIAESLIDLRGKKYLDKYLTLVASTSNISMVGIYEVDQITGVASQLAVCDSNFNGSPLVSLPKALVDGLDLQFCLDHNDLSNFMNGIETSFAENDSLTGSRVFDEDGKLIACIVYVFTDLHLQEQIKCLITNFKDRIASEVESILLRKGVEKATKDLRYLVETSRDMIWEIDLKGNFVSVNRSSIMIYGYYPEEMKGMHFSRLMSESAAKEYESYLDKSIQGNGIYDIVANHLNKHDRPIQIIYNARPKYSLSGELIGFSGTTTDITESVRAQVAIRNNSELFSAILARLPVIFFRVDENGYLVDIRGQGLKRMGVDDMAWVGRPGYGLFVGMDEMIDSALSGKTVHFRSSGTFEGNSWWFYTSMFFDSWTGFGAVGFAVDITEQMESEEKLVELLKDNRVLAQRLVEVQEEERRNLSRELHDELGQSITAVKSLATAITAAAGDSYSEIRSLGNSIVDLSGRLYEVVNSLMRRLRPDILDSLGFEETINSCVTNSQLEKTGVNCSLKIIGKIEDLDEVVQITVYRIVQECLTNISKYAMASNVFVTIERQESDQPGHSEAGSRKSDKLLINVTDDGVGMNLDSDASSSVSEPKMGLQGIKERVTALGGELEIRSLPGKGVSVEVIIDLASRKGSNTCKATPGTDEILPSSSLH